MHTAAGVLIHIYIYNFLTFNNHACRTEIRETLRMLRDNTRRFQYVCNLGPETASECEFVFGVSKLLLHIIVE